MRHPRLLIVLVVGALAAIAVVWHPWYTPTTTAFVVNDTNGVVTLDNCGDVSVTISPGKRAEISPFVDAKRAYCEVFNGGGDLGVRQGCLYLPSSKGRVVSGVTAHVTATRACGR